MKSILIATSLLMSLTAFGQEGDVKLSNEGQVARASATSMHADLMVGAAIPTGDIGDAIDTRFGYGANFLVDVTPMMSLGAFVSTNSGEINDIDDLTLRLTYYGLVTHIKMNQNLFFQGKVGLSSLKVKNDAGAGSVSDTYDENPFILGAGIGAEFPITMNMSFAPVVSYTHSFKTGDGANEVDSYGLVEAMAALRFNF